MQFLRGSRRQRLDALISIFGVLGILLIVLAVLALWSDLLDLMARFRQPVLMFVIGAILAYLLVPAVRLLERALRKRWAAILSAYLLLFAVLAVFAVLLINPFISQARSLADNLHNPSASSLTGLATVDTLSRRVDNELRRQLAGTASTITPSALKKSQTDIQALQRDVALLPVSAPIRGQIQLPSSYVIPIKVNVDRLERDYGRVATSSSTPDRGLLTRTVADAAAAKTAAGTAYTNASSTPLLLLHLQRLLDDRGIQVDLHDKFGRALQQLTGQLASLLNNALGIALQAGNLLLTTVLILIISVYFVSDGARFLHWLTRLGPPDTHDNAEYLRQSLDRILGSYLRVQVLLALLAGVLAAIGALVFGVPYAIVIFFSTFFLSLVPVIGPVVLPIPPALIAVVFTPMPKPVLFLLWLLIGEQILTNIIGPRIQGQSVGIHPLEAMAAALVGFPIAGFLGSFFAVPMVAFAHVVAREVIRIRQGLTAEGDEPPPPPGGGSAAIHALDTA